MTSLLSSYTLQDRFLQMQQHYSHSIEAKERRLMECAETALDTSPYCPGWSLLNTTDLCHRGYSNKVDRNLIKLAERRWEWINIRAEGRETIRETSFRGPKMWFLYLEVTDGSGDRGGQQPYQSYAGYHTAPGSRCSVPATVTYDCEVPIEGDECDGANGHHDVCTLQCRHQLTQHRAQGPLPPAKRNFNSINYRNVVIAFVGKNEEFLLRPLEHWQLLTSSLARSVSCKHSGTFRLWTNTNAHSAIHILYY